MIVQSGCSSFDLNFSFVGNESRNDWDCGFRLSNSSHLVLEDCTLVIVGVRDTHKV